MSSGSSHAVIDEDMECSYTFEPTAMQVGGQGNREPLEDATNPTLS
jgi:hypothetical protein